MLWKILSALAAIALAVGLWFAYQDQLAIKVERDLARRSKENLKATTDKLTEATDVKGRKEKELVDLEKQRDDVKIEVTKVATDTEQKLAEVEVIKKNLEEVTKQLAQLDEQIRKAGNIKQLMAQVEELNKQKTAAEAAIANHKQQLALAEEKSASLNSEVTRLQDVEKRQRSGVVEPGFSARVAHPYADFGFVVLNKGNLGGIFANAMLDVKRGDNVVAKLKVREVEQAMSVADLVPGSLASGDAIRSGDLVVASKAQPNAALPTVPATPASPTATPAPGAAPAAPGGMADPFAAGGMAAPAPAPAPAAPAAADPFGAAPAPAGGMAPAPAPAAPAAPGAADPFAPMPPAGAAPAAGAAAPAAGTPAPAAPGTADPFAPTPPGGTTPPPAPPK